MRYSEAAQMLEHGFAVTMHPTGNSMRPLIESGQRVVIDPVSRTVQKGDIVLAKVKGRYYLHLVSAVGADGRPQISNNRGHVNGWASKVFGIVVEIG